MASSSGTVTSLTYSFYDASKYRLDDGAGLSLSSLNKSFLYLFNNDIWLYSRLNGKYKGLWWKTWYDGRFDSGYEAGDIVTSNNVPTLRFLQRNWKAIQRMVNKLNTSDPMPDFNKNDQKIINRYMTEVSDLFYLGNSELEQQLHISLKGDNKEPVPNGTAWQPYLVTAEELSKKSHLLESLFQEALKAHEESYHTGLDALDAADKDYELGRVESSIYDSELKRYLPKVATSEKDSFWLDFIQRADGLKLLALGAMPQDFLHIVKPLGTDHHRLETWVRNDGYVRVRGYVPVALLDEVIPKEGTIEYNWWRMGGMKNYSLRLDYAINNAYSKLFFARKKIEDGVTDEDTSGVAPTKLIRAETPGSMPTSGVFDIDKFQEMLTQLTQHLDGIEDVTEPTSDEKPTFKNDDDAWATSANVNVPEGSQFPDQFNDAELETTHVTILLNPKKIKTDVALINPKLRSSNIGAAPILVPSQFLNEINSATDESEDGKIQGKIIGTYWKVVNDSVDVDDATASNPTVTRELTFKLELTEEQATELLKGCKGSTVVLDSPTEGKTLSEFLNSCTDDGLTVESIEAKNTAIDDTRKCHAKYQKVTIVSSTPSSISIPAPTVPDPSGPAPGPTNIEIPQPSPPQVSFATVTKNDASVRLIYDTISSIQASVELKEPPEGLVNVATLMNDMEEMAEATSDEDDSGVAYRILFNNDSTAMLIFFPNNCKDTDGNLVDIRHIEDAAPGTEVAEGDFALIKSLFEKCEVKEEISDDATSVVYSFRKERVKGSTNPDEDTEEEEQTESEIVVPEGVVPVDYIVDEAVVASDIRLMREYGITHSPAIKTVTSTDVVPAGPSLLLPLTESPNIDIKGWSPTLGQQVIFKVPNGCQDIGFEICGVADMERFETLDGSVYFMREGDEVRWLRRMTRIRALIAKIRCAKELGRISESPLMDSSLTMIENIWNAVVERKFFVTHLQLRNLDTTELAALERALENEFADAAIGNLSSIITNAYDVYSQLLAEDFRVDGFYRLYKEFADDKNIDDDLSLVKRLMCCRAIKWLRIADGDFPSTEQQSEDYLQELKDAVDASSQALKSAAASELSCIYDKLVSLFVKRNEIVNEIDDSKNDIELNDARTELLNNLLVVFLEGDIPEIVVYCVETEKSLREITEVKAKLESFLATPGIGNDLRGEIELRLAFLQDHSQRFIKPNLDICAGYLNYLQVRKVMYYGDGATGESEKFNDTQGKLEDLTEKLESFMHDTWEANSED